MWSGLVCVFGLGGVCLSATCVNGSLGSVTEAVLITALGGYLFTGITYVKTQGSTIKCLFYFPLEQIYTQF